jgi:hypothetical protein
MKISEITEANGNNNSKISRIQGNKVTVDRGDGVETTIDTNKNPNAINQDEKGEVSVDTEPANSAMKKQQQSRIRPGQKVNVKNNET